jgi:hypothetical protein
MSEYQELYAAAWVGPSKPQVLEALQTLRESATRAQANNPAKAEYFAGAEKAMEDAIRVLLGDGQPMPARPRVPAIELNALDASTLVEHMCGLIERGDAIEQLLSLRGYTWHPFYTRLAHFMGDVHLAYGAMTMSVRL